MGVQIRYCDECRSRIDPGDFESGKVLQLLGKAYCPACSKKIQAEMEAGKGGGSEASHGASPRRGTTVSRKSRDGSPAPFDFMKADPGKGGSGRDSAAAEESEETGRRRTPSGRTTRSPAASTGIPPRVLAIAGIGGLAVGLVVLLVWVLGAGGGGETADVPPRPAKAPDRKAPAPAPAAKNAPHPAEVGAQKAWESAAAWESGNPGAWLEAREKYVQAMESCKGTRFEKMVKARIEEGDRQADAAGEKAFRDYERDVRPLADRKNFDRAVEVYEKYRKQIEASQSWAEKAIDLHQQIGRMHQAWKTVRQLQVVDGKIAEVNKAGIFSVFAEASFDLRPALEGTDLSSWKPAPPAAWSASDGVLTGKSGTEPVEIRFGGDDWVDYVLEAEFQIAKGPGFHLLVHALEAGDRIEVAAENHKEPGVWYLLRCAVWGDLAHYRSFKSVAKILAGNIKCNETSSRGGFGFRLPKPDSEVSFRNIRYRRVSTPEAAWTAPRDGWYPMLDERSPGCIDDESERNQQGGFSLEKGILTARSDTGGTFLTFGSPSWTRFELAFGLRNLVKAFQIEIRRPLGFREILEGCFERAALEVPEALASGDGWRQALVQVQEQEAVLLIDGVPKIKARFESLGGREVLSPVRIGFLKGFHAGGRFEMKELRVKVDARGGGF